MEQYTMYCGEDGRTLNAVLYNNNTGETHTMHKSLAAKKVEDIRRKGGSVEIVVIRKASKAHKNHIVAEERHEKDYEINQLYTFSLKPILVTESEIPAALKARGIVTAKQYQEYLNVYFIDVEDVKKVKERSKYYIKDKKAKSDNKLYNYNISKVVKTLEKQDKQHKSGERRKEPEPLEM